VRHVIFQIPDSAAPRLGLARVRDGGGDGTARTARGLVSPEDYHRGIPEAEPVSVGGPEAFLATRLGDATIDVNSLVFHGEELEPKKLPGVYRIFVLGGSTIFGYLESIPSNPEAHPYKLKIDLRERLHDPKLAVVNAGVTSYTLRTSG